MNNFHKSSQKERAVMTSLFEKNNITEYEFTDITGYERYDGIYKDVRGKLNMFEVKVRNVRSTDYKDTVIEKHKFEYLRSECERLNMTPLVFIFFTDGYYAVFNLNTTEYYMMEFFAPKTTAVKSEKTHRIQVCLPINKKYKYNI